MTLYFIIWFLTSLGAAYFLYKKVRIFAKGLGVVIIISAAVVATILHNLISLWLDFKEPIFSVVALWAFGIGIFLFSIWLVKLLSNTIFSKNG